MRTLIVFAHPEPQSFGAALLQRARQTLAASGHEVQVSDLYAMGFNPVASAADFAERRFPHRLQYDREQKYSSEHRCFSPDIQAESESRVGRLHLPTTAPIRCCASRTGGRIGRTANRAHPR